MRSMTLCQLLYQLETIARLTNLSIEEVEEIQCLE